MFPDADLFETRKRRDGVWWGWRLPREGARRNGSGCACAACRIMPENQETNSGDLYFGCETKSVISLLSIQCVCKNSRYQHVLQVDLLDPMEVALDGFGSTFLKNAFDFFNATL